MKTSEVFICLQLVLTNRVPAVGTPAGAQDDELVISDSFGIMPLPSDQIGDE